jgi:hypothetical protein
MAVTKTKFVQPIAMSVTLDRPAYVMRRPDRRSAASAKAIELFELGNRKVAE